MKLPAAASTEPAITLELIGALETLRARMLAREDECASRLAEVAPGRRADARNLAHYLALREHDLRGLQERLSALGASSLGRSEPQVLASVDRVLGLLRRAAGVAPAGRRTAGETSPEERVTSLQRNADELLGPAPAHRSVRIMVTLPSEAAGDAALVHALVEAGMDIARINCAHDDAPRWQAMADHVRSAARSLGRPVRILTDLAGPKLRTGRIAPGPVVLKLRPLRDDFGRVLAPARVGLLPQGSAQRIRGALAHLGVSPDWLLTLEAGERIELIDARGARRSLRVARRDEDGVLAEADRTLYLVPQTELLRRERCRGPRSTQVFDLPGRPGSVFLRRGDRLRLERPAATPSSESRPAPAARGIPAANDGPPAIACTLPEVFAQVRAGERVWFDDGRIGGTIRCADADGIEVEIDRARPEGETLRGDKGINLPDSSLELPALTGKDLEDLAVVAGFADLVGLSFVQHAEDVHALRARLDAAGATRTGILLKIETRRAFERLPELMFAAMAGPASGVMIARGDLAVECGYERLAEVQEEILWAAEAAHMPVVWATQVLETLAKTGRPSRAEITDAAMGERAECVMLNKGPHIVDAMRTLDDILCRMQGHQAKKRPLLRALGAWR
ncbi:pyruvate kinase [Quisquiliibacterium transsilvanicum]|uniref:pyruvate kinase n=1 Tax=Quisquiliibacterium transsilvanicum TaxID=1549638 RepID=A0A7W8HHR4_9BURK|nr:pyruvate kinase [Quisquiliibacterium transsilvanicum]MBB5272289.1 pyruvate kinase [Quisquiliibacterium transsilvanicum]